YRPRKDKGNRGHESILFGDEVEDTAARDRSPELRGSMGDVPQQKLACRNTIHMTIQSNSQRVGSKSEIPITLQRTQRLRHKRLQAVGRRFQDIEAVDVYPLEEGAY